MATSPSSWAISSSVRRAQRGLAKRTVAGRPRWVTWSPLAGSRTTSASSWSSLGAARESSSLAEGVLLVTWIPDDQPEVIAAQAIADRGRQNLGRVARQAANERRRSSRPRTPVPRRPPSRSAGERAHGGHAAPPTQRAPRLRAPLPGPLVHDADLFRSLVAALHQRPMPPARGVRDRTVAVFGSSLVATAIRQQARIESKRAN
jgi:hypothetical protein